jgi:hypothetical protein
MIRIVFAEDVLFRIGGLIFLNSPLLDFDIGRLIKIKWELKLTYFESAELGDVLVLQGSLWL